MGFFGSRRRFRDYDYERSCLNLTLVSDGRIDLILSNMKDISLVSVLNNLISDHFPIVIVKKHKNIQVE